MIADSGVYLEALSAEALAVARRDLVTLLQACVDAGASIGFLSPLSEPEATDFWRGIEPSVRSGHRTVIVAREGGERGRIVGSAQLAFETKANGRHRAEVNKVMVLPTYRRMGIAGRLMAELERVARGRSLRLLFLDTSEGPGGAQAFYDTLGYVYAGGIPEYALDPDGRPVKNAIYYKLL